MITLSSIDRDVLIRTVYGEARGESMLGQSAVIHVVFNRVANPGWWGRTVFEVCSKREQFSCWNMGDPNREKCLDLKTFDKAYIEIEREVDDCLDHLILDPTNGADSYKVYGTHASWDWDVTGSGVRIGKHIFYHLGLQAHPTRPAMT